MEQATETVQATSSARGRLWLWLGILTVPLALTALVIQYAVLKQLVVPWYLAVLPTLGGLLLAVAVFQRPSFGRGLGLACLVALAAVNWYVLLVVTRLDSYAGPAQAGQPVPTFTTTLADGTTFSDKDLQGNGSSVLLFFRGRW